MKLFRIIILVIGVLFVDHAWARPEIIQWQQQGISIVLKDHLLLPQMNWPQTLLHYPVDFSAFPITEEELELIDRTTGLAIPFQLVQKEKKDDKIRSAVLCFKTDMPAGSEREFRLQLKSGNAKTSELTNPVRISVKGKRTELNNGLIRIILPSKGIHHSLASSSLQIGDPRTILGYSVLPPNLRLDRLSVSELETGPLESAFLLHYQFKEGKSLKLTVKLASGMEFIEIEEDMNGFPRTDNLAWKLVWDQIDVRVRYCPNLPSDPIDKTKKGYANFAWEPIAGSDGDPFANRHPNLPYDQKNLPDGKLPFKITPYHNWMTWWRLHTAAFWNEQTGESIAIFIKDFENWVDPSYPIWGSKDDMAIHFFYRDDKLSWSFPLVTGKRSVAWAIYPHEKDIQEVDKTNLAQVYIDYLRRWYGWISLDMVKDWILDYASGSPVHPAFFTSADQEMKGNPKDLLNDLKRTVGGMATASERGKGPSPVATRAFYEHIAPLFELAEPALTEQEYRQARALFLFMTYVFMDEALMPMKNMLSGHPNFLADIKGVPGLAAFLFPDHPQAKEMADHFEKSVALNLRYHTRPDVTAWDAKGGRWTENLATYTWAFLRPTLKTSFLLHHKYDGKNRILQPNITLLGDWLLNSLTSPLDQVGGRRTYPPQGAHARVLTPSNLLFILGNELNRYDPILAEHIFWVTSPDDLGFEASSDRPDAWNKAFRSLLNHPGGTNPKLKSAKYTGYGFNLRQNFGKPGEMYVHLQQIDDGPNYRWGRAAKGGNGIIYYYAEGKRYSHNGVEDVGDAPFGDTERCTNFGVKKEKGCYRCIGDYRSVGRNELTEPLFDFGFAQFASIRANNEAAPEYRSRSVLMSGNDYILIFDDVNDASVEGRLSWFVGKDDDFPYIHQLMPGIKPTAADIQPSDTPYYTDKGEFLTKGLYFDGKGDFLTLVTHRESIQPEFSNGVCRVAGPDKRSEWVFRSDKDIMFTEKQFTFEGTAGLIRLSADKKQTKAALFRGNKIGVPGLTAEFVDAPGYAGISIENITGGYSGLIQGETVTEILFTLSGSASDLIFYLDGNPLNLQKDEGHSYRIKVPAGRHSWQWTRNGVIPEATEIIRSVSGEDWCEIEWSSVAGATNYLIEKSVDGGNNWTTVKTGITATHYRVTDLITGQKCHLRVRTKGAGGFGPPSNDYPVYPSKEKPNAPEGLRVEKNGNIVQISWGQILGADQYALYQQTKGKSDWKKVYFGKNRSATLTIPDDAKIYEFYVTATNGNGESEKSIPADTDPSRLINWYPVPAEIFRRDTESHENGYEEYNHWIEQEMPVLTYPFQER